MVKGSQGGKKRERERERELMFGRRGDSKGNKW